MTLNECDRQTSTEQRYVQQDERPPNSTNESHDDGESVSVGTPGTGR